MLRLAMTASFMLLAFGHVSAQEAPAPELDPVGVYDFSTAVDGTVITGVLTLRRGEDGRVGGTVSTDVTGEVPLQSVTVEGRRIVMRSRLPDGDLYMQMDVLEDDRITGGWELSSGMSGGMSGQKRKPAG
jgi:hypothetical protein